MNHGTGYKVTITDAERWTLTRTIKQEIKIEPIFRTNTKKRPEAALTSAKV